MQSLIQIKNIKIALAISTLFAISCCTGANSVTAQQNRIVDTTTPEVPTEIRTGFRPSYTVNPVTHRLTGRRGERLDFRFELAALRDGVVASVSPVALRQDTNGAILADINAEPPSALSIKGGQSTYQLEEDEPVVVEGFIRIPSGPAPAHKFGILIRDEPIEALSARQKDQQFGVKFVTQYIMQFDIEVTNGRSEGIRKLVIQSAELVTLDGLPLARVKVNNPTEETAEFEIDCRLSRDSNTRPSRNTSLAVPIRSRMDEPDRWVTKILPGATLHMEYPWQEAVTPGEYTMDVRLTRKRRVFVEEEFPLLIESNDFPAQESYVITLADGVNVSPSQIALGNEKPLGRSTKVVLKNDSESETRFRFSLRDDRTDPNSKSSWATVRPSSLDLAARTKRTVVLSMGRVKDRSENRLAWLVIEQIDADGKVVDQTPMPVAWFGSVEESLQLAVGDADVLIDVAASDDVGMRLELPVTNNSTVPFPLSARFNTTDVANNQVQRSAGFGKWLLPGEQKLIAFPIGDIPFRSGPIIGSIDFFDANQNVVFSKPVRIER